MKWILSLFLLMWAIPTALPAATFTDKPSAKHEATWKEFNSAVDDKTAEIKALLFGPITRILGMLGIAYGVAMLLMGKTQPIITYGGIGLLLNVIPYFVDSIFGATIPWM